MELKEEHCIIPAFQKYGIFTTWSRNCIDDESLTKIKNDVFRMMDTSLDKFKKSIIPSGPINEWIVEFAPEDKMDLFENIVGMYRKPYAVIEEALMMSDILYLINRFAFFYEKLTGRGMASYVGEFNAIRWQKDVIQNFNNPNIRYFVFCLGKGFHWTCIIIDKKTRICDFYDSLDHDIDPDLKRIIRQNLNLDNPNTGRRYLWNDSSLGKRQNDGTSCGMHVLAYTFFRCFKNENRGEIVGKLSDQFVQAFFNDFTVKSVADDAVFEGLGRDDTIGYHRSSGPQAKPSDEVKGSGPRAKPREEVKGDVPWYEWECVKNCDVNKINNILDATVIEKATPDQQARITSECCFDKTEVKRDIPWYEWDCVKNFDQETLDTILQGRSVENATEAQREQIIDLACFETSHVLKTHIPAFEIEFPNLPNIYAELCLSGNNTVDQHRIEFLERIFKAFFICLGSSCINYNHDEKADELHGCEYIYYMFNYTINNELFKIIADDLKPEYDSHGNVDVAETTRKRSKIADILKGMVDEKDLIFRSNESDREIFRKSENIFKQLLYSARKQVQDRVRPEDRAYYTRLIASSAGVMALIGVILSLWSKTNNTI